MRNCNQSQRLIKVEYVVNRSMYWEVIRVLSLVDEIVNIGLLMCILECISVGQTYCIGITLKLINI